MPNEEALSALQREIELEKARLPWWKKPFPVATVTAILASVVPITTAVSAGYQKSKELGLQELKQKQDAAMEQMKITHSVQMDYLQRMDGGDVERSRTLRMILALNDDKRLLKWAKDEKDTVDKAISDLEEANAAVAQERDQQIALTEQEKGRPSGRGKEG